MLNFVNYIMGIYFVDIRTLSAEVAEIPFICIATIFTGFA